MDKNHFIFYLDFAGASRCKGAHVTDAPILNISIEEEEARAWTREHWNSHGIKNYSNITVEAYLQIPG